MEVIDNLIKIIKKHQEGLPNVEPLEVDSEFEKVLHDTDDGKLDIKNEMYYCTGLRKVHTEVAKLGNLNIVHCIWYPDPEFDLPIFGVDIVANKDVKKNIIFKRVDALKYLNRHKKYDLIFDKNNSQPNLPKRTREIT